VGIEFSGDVPPSAAAVDGAVVVVLDTAGAVGDNVDGAMGMAELHAEQAPMRANATAARAASADVAPLCCSVSRSSIPQVARNCTKSGSRLPAAVKPTTSHSG
jgi:hypothetical protein